jgi:carbamoylphosphate synthase large subunit
VDTRQVLYINLVRNAGKITKWGEFEELRDLIKKAANRMNFKNLMREVNAGLKEPLAFEEEFLSLQKVRNCLEHRHGIVAEIDVDHSNGMRLALPHTKIFFVKDGQEIEVAMGQRFKEETAISIRLVTRERFFSLGSRVAFSREEFDEIAMGSWLFASDLASKLPDVAVACEPAG